MYKQLFMFISLATCGNSFAYTCFYQELHDPKTKKSIGWPGAWEQCVDDAKKKGPQTNLVVWLEDDNGKFVRGEFANGDIKTAEWHAIEVGQEQQFLQGVTKSAEKTKPEAGAQPQPTATKPSMPAAREQASEQSARSADHKKRGDQRKKKKKGENDDETAS